MTATETIASVCQIAEDFGRDTGLAPFEIERVVRSRSKGKPEWIIQVQFEELAERLVPDHSGAIIVVDMETNQPRLMPGL